MFFFLSKTLNYFTMPLVIVCALMVSSVFVKGLKWKKWLFRSGLILLLFFSNDFIANELMRAWEVPPVPISSIKKQYTWGIVLSGVTKSEMSPKDRVYLSRGADRITHTFLLYKKGIIKKILVSGGSGRLIDIGQKEADEIASLLILFGVKPEDILTENISRNTHESALEVKGMLEGKAVPADCLLITSAFHMRRSAACFAKAGWPMDVFSTDFFSHKRKYSVDVLLTPSMEGLSDWHILVKEWVGYIAYAMAGYI